MHVNFLLVYTNFHDTETSEDTTLHFFQINFSFLFPAFETSKALWEKDVAHIYSKRFESKIEELYRNRNYSKLF